MLGYDINGDGKVTVKEFKRIMARTGKLWNVQALVQVQPISTKIYFQGKWMRQTFRKWWTKLILIMMDPLTLKNSRKWWNKNLLWSSCSLDRTSSIKRIQNPNCTYYFVSTININLTCLIINSALLYMSSTFVYLKAI